MSSNFLPSIDFPRGIQSLQTALATRHEYVDGGKTYVSFNGMREIAVRPGGVGEIKNIISTPRVPFVFNTYIPYGALVLREIEAHDIYLSTLLLPKSNVPHSKKMEGGTLKYFLAQNIIDCWFELERTLRGIVACVLKHTPLSIPVVEPNFPTSFGFQAGYESYERMVRHAFGAKHAFEIFLAWTVYVVVVCGERGRIPLGATILTPSCPRWIHSGVKGDCFNAKWINDFLFSPVFDFRSDRVGTFILLDTCPFLSDIPFFLRAGIPFSVIFPGDVAGVGLLASANIPDEVKGALQPNKQVFDSRWQVPGHSKWSAPSSKGSWGEPSNKEKSSVWDAPQGIPGWTPTPVWAPVSTGPSLSEVKRQQRLKSVYPHWMDFFHARNTRNGEKFTSIANDAEKVNMYWQRRDAAMIAIYQTTCPSGPPLYVWELFDEDPTLWERKAYEQTKKEQWLKSDPHERVFDEVKHEWDICPDMGKAIPPPPSKWIPPEDDEDVDDEFLPVKKIPADLKVIHPYINHLLWKERHPDGVEDMLPPRPPPKVKSGRRKNQPDRQPVSFVSNHPPQPKRRFSPPPRGPHVSPHSSRAFEHSSSGARYPIPWRARERDGYDVPSKRRPSPRGGYRCPYDRRVSHSPPPRPGLSHFHDNFEAGRSLAASSRWDQRKKSMDPLDGHTNPPALPSPVVLPLSLLQAQAQGPMPIQPMDAEDVLANPKVVSAETREVFIEPPPPSNASSSRRAAHVPVAPQRTSGESTCGSRGRPHGS